MQEGLRQILASTCQRVEAALRTADMRLLEQQAERHMPRGFRKGLQEKAEHGIAVIAELKKASPSKGMIRKDFLVEALAKQLFAAGAAALSVLTDEVFFQGSLANLRMASAATPLPCLRKDFIVHEFQLLEAKANSADAVLLIVAALEPAQLAALHKRARELGLDILCEVHDENELERAVAAGCNMVGVNSRDLHTFCVDLDAPLRLASKIPKGVLRVAESGIRSPQDIQKLRTAGYQAFLVGESLMRAENPGEALRKLVAESLDSTSGAKMRIG